MIHELFVLSYFTGSGTFQVQTYKTQVEADAAKESVHVNLRPSVCKVNSVDETDLQKTCKHGSTFADSKKCTFCGKKVDYVNGKYIDL